MYDDRGAEALRTPELHLRIVAIEDGLKLLTDVEKLLPKATPETSVESPAPQTSDNEVEFLRLQRAKQESSTKEALEKGPQITNAQQNVDTAYRTAA